MFNWYYLVHFLLFQWDWYVAVLQNNPIGSASLSISFKCLLLNGLIFLLSAYKKPESNNFCISWKHGAEPDGFLWYVPIIV